MLRRLGLPAGSSVSKSGTTCRTSPLFLARVPRSFSNLAKTSTKMHCILTVIFSTGYYMYRFDFLQTFGYFAEIKRKCIFHVQNVTSVSRASAALFFHFSKHVKQQCTVLHSNCDLLNRILYVPF